jgi:very-short-patch-repair endonuclease
MKLSDIYPTNYAVNVVAVKLWGLVGSPIEFILDLAIFKKLDEQPGWKCWVYSVDEYRQVVVEQTDTEPALFALVPQLPINEVGDVDLGVFIPSISKRRPVVIVECDGHEFHERTPEQASNDRRRDRRLQRYRIPPLRFTGTDIVRASEEYAREIVNFIGERVNRISATQ